MTETELANIKSTYYDNWPQPKASWDKFVEVFTDTDESPAQKCKHTLRFKRINSRLIDQKPETQVRANLNYHIKKSVEDYLLGNEVIPQQLIKDGKVSPNGEIKAWY
jgi:hypothetical protein